MEKLPPKEDMEYSYALYPDLSMVKIFFHLLYYLSFAFALYVRTGTYHFFFSGLYETKLHMPRLFISK